MQRRSESSTGRAARSSWKAFLATTVTAAAMLLLAACNGDAEPTATTAARVTTSPVASPATVASPVASPVSSPVASPRPSTPVSSPVASPVASPTGSGRAIPGLNAQTVTTNLNAFGAQCTGPTTQGANQQWVCTVAGATQQRVEMLGPSANQITTLRATVAGARSSVPIAREFIASVATFPFEGANATNARQWVIDNLERGGTTTIAGTMLKIEWQGDTLVMEMSAA